MLLAPAHAVRLRPTPAPPPQLVAAIDRARTFFGQLGVTAAEGSGPVPVVFDPTVTDAAYQADALPSPGASRDRPTSERILIGTDPFTGRPFHEAPDIVYHEFAHRVQQHLVPGLGEAPTSRIVDESLADTFAAAIDGNWTLAEQLVPGGIRSAAEPGRQLMLDGGCRKVVETPARIEQMTTAAAALGPYHNIGPLNHAAYLVGSSLGLDPMARIYLQALRRHLQPGSGTTDLVIGTIRGAIELYGAGSAQERVVRDAWKAVGVRAAAVDSV